MRKYDKIVQQAFLDDEEEVIKRLKAVYNQSLKDITKKTEELQDSINALQMGLLNGEMSDAERQQMQTMIQSKIYLRDYQKAMKTQINGILDNLQVEEFKTVSEYLNKCYEQGFMGAMYSLQQQGVPLCFPMDQESLVRAVQLDSKISQGLYSRLGEDVSLLKRKITSEISRGIATGMTFKQIAKQLEGQTNIGFNNAVRISRTEGHRIQVQSAMDACYKAKDKGADVVKQWDATLDGNTRESHSKVDGEIRELDEKFSNGLMFPGDPSGGAAEVVNCRCALLQRARWALDEAELETLKERAAFYGIDKNDSFEDFKKKYLKAAKDNTDYIWSAPRTETEKIVLDEIKNYHKQLSDKYGIDLGIVGDKLADLQSDWDMALKWNTQEYMKEHPKVTKARAESIVKKTMMQPRPTESEISILEGGQYWHDTTRIVKENGEYTLKHIKKIIVNQNASDFGMTIKESEEKIAERFAKIERRRAKGRTSRLYLSNATEGGAGTYLHEYGHAVDFTNGIAENPKFLEWYNSLSENEICEGLSSYAATNANEFIAEAFAESFFSYQRPMSKKFMSILDDILKSGGN